MLLRVLVGIVAVPEPILERLDGIELPGTECQVVGVPVVIGLPAVGHLLEVDGDREDADLGI